MTPGCLITDAKGLHDHLHKTGGAATETQSASDRWTPRWKQLDDPLTKEMSGSLWELRIKRLLSTFEATLFPPDGQCHLNLLQVHAQTWALTAIDHSKHRCPRALQNRALPTLLACFLVWLHRWFLLGLPA